ncbi:maleylpyruvate isomerase family mycothiol-dependent enzyme [Nocardiopsis changdeensis]|uniref:Maleylpyruvate isomerase family mycothiol-dependent enzyme n=1 Tax=Nocardiopsis changdeensis TaxID=2831969 RepID=A0ABX8BIK5_9ACTN|nr:MULTISPECIES: maleylpyruvate isomerase family mycothiol-dependent enzyme [Nocardiopsis]QUX21164.1 maleylpyruvate isomerase family mycothiol-dependent enzyme [Nocardiopsis changdeensis]QYX37094.1 maleylpyruvate isomerase family mycothiol-dependent enzyme [Nocardiopsis sp. MT53]
MNGVWALVHAERRALVEDLAGLPPDRWGTPSLCDGWTVHDVAAHLVDSARTTRVGFVLGMLRARLDFDRLNGAGVARERGNGPADTLERLREVAPRTTAPPAPLDTRLVEEVVHGEDIRRPLGIVRAYPPEAVERALRLQARTPAAYGGGRERAAGLRLAAAGGGPGLGDGPVVSGTALDLLLALSGRGAALEGLGGPGADALRARL